ncbi:mechanosensitive ion channel family protein [Chitinilyticum piscinae]|uniref:Mechanosensitive ion channel n=1 Tax=Chitinilyticum piscinae TaxID=2866724 RepID=A0A8J7FIP8_9NEIS|nr:mechanosensitive ion channel domain-containing protein [Chitinilyticum piscinae]MBE9610030.1 mechanosensitive ion channel [Chitinilyticum piscinae]
MIEKHNLVIELIADVQRVGIHSATFWWQLAVVAVALVVAGLISRQVRRKVAAQADTASSALRIGREGLTRIWFPLNAFLLVKIGHLALQQSMAGPYKLLSLAALLLMAMANIRVLVYVLRHVFNNARWVQNWERRIALGVWVLYALHIIGVLPEITEYLDSLAFNVGKTHISLLTIIYGLFSVAMTMLVAMWIGREAERRLMKSETLDMNVRVVMVKVIQSALVVLAVIVALPLVGIDLTVLSVFGGAIGIGLGFGLQKIASNYVSGFIILLDRSIKLGDMIQVDNRTGIIRGLTSRYVVLRSADGTEALIPNETLVTSTVVNQSYTDRSIWVGLPVQVAYGTDLELATRLLAEIARAHPRVCDTPEPGGFVAAFADSGINLTLGFFLRDPENGQLGLKHELNMAIWKAFQQHGIEIPYPRRDVYVHQAGDARQAETF